ncbi:glycosyltransferase, partial [Patescibacteria group bacterium]
VISDNNSKDRTAEIGKQLAEENEAVDYVFVPEQGKGSAVIEVWKRFKADIYGFMDADLATDLNALRPALEAIKENDIAVGSRRIKGAQVQRELYRKFTSAVLNFLIRMILRTKIRDTACGFKFFKHEVIDKILPQIKDRKWTFDTEILILAERAGFKIKEIPVKWEEKQERTSKIVPVPTILGYLRKILELKRRKQKT